MDGLPELRAMRSAIKNAMLTVAFIFMRTPPISITEAEGALAAVA